MQLFHCLFLLLLLAAATLAAPTLDVSKRSEVSHDPGRNGLGDPATFTRAKGDEANTVVIKHSYQTDHYYRLGEHKKHSTCEHCLFWEVVRVEENMEFHVRPICKKWKNLCPGGKPKPLLFDGPEVHYRLDEVQIKNGHVCQDWQLHFHFDLEARLNNILTPYCADSREVIEKWFRDNPDARVVKLLPHNNDEDGVHGRNQTTNAPAPVVPYKDGGPPSLSDPDMEHP